MDVHEISMNCKRTEFVGTAVLDTIGLCIAGVDDTLLKTMNIGTRYHALGLFLSLIHIYPVYHTQTECVLAAHFKLAENCQAAADQLAEMITACGNHLETGFVGTP